MVDGLRISILHRMMKFLVTVLNGVGRHGGGDLTNVQCKAIGNCHTESPIMNIC
jgi:hypothetical protein